MAKLSVPLDASKIGKDAENLSAYMLRYIVGQNDAVEQIVNIYQMFLSGMRPPGRPIGNFLFLGPTGSGKTRTVEVTAEGLVGNPKAIVKIDCAEFQHSHEIAKIIGSPPGYIGHRETHSMLSQEVLNQFHTEKIKISFVLFDEIEKASDSLWNLLLGILDKATLTLGDNNRVDFSNSMIFMTSNLGAAEMSNELGPRFGFFTKTTPENNAGLSEKIRKIGIEAARRKFMPEFFNRLDKVAVFHSLGRQELMKILDIELKMLQEQILKVASTNFGFSLTDNAKNHILSQGFDMRYGARYLKRAIEHLLIQPFSNLIGSGQIKEGDWINVDLAMNRLIFSKEAGGLSFGAITQTAEAQTGPLNFKQRGGKQNVAGAKFNQQGKTARKEK